MIAFLRSIDDDVWDSVEEGYSRPTVDTNGKTIPKPKAHWTLGEKHLANYDSSVINAIYNGATATEFPHAPLQKMFGTSYRL